MWLICKWEWIDTWEFKNLTWKVPSLANPPVKETSISFADWKAQFKNDETEKAVLADLQLAQAYGVNSAPTLVINQKYAIAGAQSQEEIEKLLDRISKDEGIPLNKLQTLQTDNTGSSCSIVDGKWKCD